MKKQNNWDLEQTQKCFEDAGVDKSYYETYGQEKCDKITNNVFMGTTVQQKLKCLQENNAYVNPMQRCSIEYDGDYVGLYNCLKNIKNTTFTDTLSFIYDMAIAKARFWSDGNKNDRSQILLDNLNKRFKEQNKTLSVQQIKGTCYMLDINSKYNCLKRFGFPKDIDYCNGKLDLK